MNLYRAEQCGIIMCFRFLSDLREEKSGVSETSLSTQASLEKIILSLKVNNSICVRIALILLYLNSYHLTFNLLMYAC